MLGILADMDQKDSHVTVRFRLQKTVESPQLQSIIVLHRPIPMVLATTETPKLRVDTVLDVPFCRSCRFSLS